MVKPALRRAWRGRTVQFGVTPAHALRVGPLDRVTGGFLDLLDGTRSMAVLAAEARARGLPWERVEPLVHRLAAAGVVDDTEAGPPAAAALRAGPGALDRLRGELASLSVVHAAPGAACARLASRGGTRVRVHGAGRVGAAVAAALTAAGVGRVEVQDGGTVEPWDAGPGGLPPEAIGERRQAAAARLVRTSAPGGAPPGAAAARNAPLALVVVAPRDGLAAYRPEPGAAQAWTAAGIPHLYAGVVEATGFVGPLVLPGGTACAGCLLRTAAARDPHEPRMLAQWRSGRGARAVPACDGALAAAVAGLTAAHALSFLDGELPTSTGARWEVAQPLLDWRPRRVAPHPHCPCGAFAKTTASEGVGMAETEAERDTMAV